jgi:hypothetical protein
MIKAGASGAANGGYARRMGQIYLRLKNNLSATNYACIVRMLAGQTYIDVTKTMLQAYVDGGYHNTAGQIQCIAVAPYYIEYSPSAPWNNDTALTQGRQQMNGEHSYIPDTREPTISDGGDSIVANCRFYAKPRSYTWDSWNMYLTTYETGPHDAPSSGSDNVAFQYSTQGAQLLHHSIRIHAAMPNVRHFMKYTDIRSDIWSTRKYVDQDSTQSQLLAELGGVK